MNVWSLTSFPVCLHTIVFKHRDYFTTPNTIHRLNKKEEKNFGVCKYVITRAIEPRCVPLLVKCQSLFVTDHNFVLKQNKWYILCDFDITSHVTVKIWVFYLLFLNLPQYLLFLLLMLPPQKFASPPYFCARTKTVKNTNLKFTYNMIILLVMEICQLNRKLIQRFEIKINEK